MPITGSGAAAAAVVMAAKRAVQEKWALKNQQLTEAEIDEMAQEMESAGYNALFAHMVANTVVAGTVTVAPAVVGTIT